jgi:hypothetical protein
MSPKQPARRLFPRIFATSGPDVKPEHGRVLMILPIIARREPTTRDDVDFAEAYNQRFLDFLPHRPWINRVRVTMEQNACLACRSQPYELDLDELPALPHRRCTRQYGCACWYEVPEVKRSHR